MIAIRHQPGAGLLYRSRVTVMAAACLLGGCAGREAPSEAVRSEDRGAAPAPEATPEPMVDNRLAALIGEMLASAAARETFAGSVIVVDDGRTVFEQGYGYADRAGARRKNAPDTIYRIGAVSKQFTAAAILALASDGKLSLDDSVAKWFPDYPRDSLSKDGIDATLHHLLTHTSGIADGTQTTFYQSNRWRRPLSPDAIIVSAHLLPMESTPGSTHSASDYGYILLGRIIEKASGKSYESFLRDRFWTPLGMSDTGTVLPAEKQDRAAVGYEKAGREFSALAEQTVFGDPDCTLAFGAGQIYSTVRDLARWDRALASDRALSPFDTERLFRPNLANYGYGWVVEQKGDVVVQWHEGALAPLGFTSYVARIPAKGRFVALLTNLDLEAIAPIEQKVASLSIERSKRLVTNGAAPR